jgi:beta-phosphoglucomutase family hydrolase
MNTSETVRLQVDKLLGKFNAKAVIFDLDGTLIDNNSYHLETWKKYLEKSGRSISDEEFNANFNGRTNQDVIEYIYGKKISKEKSLKYTLEKEALYREIYQPYIKPVFGLLELLEIVQTKKIPMAIATSGIQPNIDFMFEHIPIKKYFEVVVNSSHITKGKPDPEIYMKTASLLGVPAKNCLVFEDAVVGIKSAKAAGMKVIAIATTHPKEELSEADMIVEDFNF